MAATSTKREAGSTRPKEKAISVSGSGPLLSQSDLTENSRRMDARSGEAKRQATSARNGGHSHSGQQSRRVEAKNPGAEISPSPVSWKWSARRERRPTGSSRSCLTWSTVGDASPVNEEQPLD
jgi:hypothetical protein